MRDSRTALWSDWGTDPFTRALAARRPVLLFVTAPWVAAGRAMEATTWRDADLRRWLYDAVVALRVDADWRPDIADRYAPEGLPTTALLSPIGEPLSSTTYVSAEALRSAIERVSATLRARFREFLTPAPATVTPPAADPAELR